MGMVAARKAGELVASMSLVLLACSGDDGPGDARSQHDAAAAAPAPAAMHDGGASTPASPTSPRDSGAGRADAGATPVDSGRAPADAGNTSPPEPSAGIAAKYPGDVGIAADPAVLFADDFEGYAQAMDLDRNWDAVYHYEHIRIASERENVYAGNKALEFTVPQQDAELSNATDKLLSPERDVLFLRYYSKFQAPFDVVGSSHNGSMISAHYFNNGQATPGVPADGRNKFLANLEDWRGEAETMSPGPLNVYVYHPEQRSQWGDHWFPTGIVLPNSSQAYDFGADFVARPDLTPELDRWYCYEYMLQANTPGQRDGRISVWIDGELKADFHNLRLRDVASLKIDRFGLSFHIGSNTAGETKKWYDNVVAATAYIGPLAKP